MVHPVLKILPATGSGGKNNFYKLFMLAFSSSLI